METINIEYSESIGIIKLARGIPNPINLQLVQECADVLRSWRDKKDVKGVVFTSENSKFFSIGFDIPQLFPLTSAEFLVFLGEFNELCVQLFSFPKPTVAALTGHAIAGGCILALCCDYRFIAQGRKLMGLNEIKLAVPVPYPGDRILRNIVGQRFARDILDSGEFYGPDTLLKMGLVDQALPPDRVLPAAIEKAGSIGSFFPPAYRAIKQNHIELVLSDIRNYTEVKDKEFIDFWYAPETRKMLENAMEKF